MKKNKKIILQNAHRLRLMDVLSGATGNFYQKCLIKELLELITFTADEVELYGIENKQENGKTFFSWKNNSELILELNDTKRINLIKILSKLPDEATDSVIIDLTQRLLNDWSELEQILELSGDGETMAVNGNSN